MLTFLPSEHEVAILREHTHAKCLTCGWLFSECECQTVIANCNTCTVPIFGREDYDRKDVNAAPFKYSIYTCEVCQEKATAA